jgi:hypothetical protein
MSIVLGLALLLSSVGLVIHIAEVRCCLALASSTEGTPFELTHEWLWLGYRRIHTRNQKLHAIVRSHPDRAIRRLARRTLNLSVISRWLMVIGIALLAATR